MIFLARGTRALAMYDAEMRGEGRGRLYLLNDGLLFDARGRGVRLEARYDSIAGAKVEKPETLLVSLRGGWKSNTLEFRICS